MEDNEVSYPVYSPALKELVSTLGNWGVNHKKRITSEILV